MPQRTIKQHYLTRSYLEKFSTPLKKKNQLWVRDLSGKWRLSRPEEEGFENDFQTIIDDSGNKSDILETVISPYEGEFINIIRQITNTRRVPKEPELNTLIFIMGLFAIRIPKLREGFKEFSSSTMKKTMGLLLKDEPTYLSQIAKMNNENPTQKIDAPYEKMSAFHKENKYILKHDSMYVLDELFKVAETVTNYLSLRQWMVIEAPHPLFITSSKPVNPFWSHKIPQHMRGKIKFIDPKVYENHPTISACYIPYSEPTNQFPSFIPGFGTLNSVIIFPLTPSFALMGSWSPLPAYRKIDYCVAQAINWITANSGADYIYSPKKLTPLPWDSEFVPFLQDFHNHQGSRLLSNKLNF